MYVYINNFNLLSWTKNTVEFIYKINCEPIIVDNASNYEPLLDWYETKPCQIIKLQQNLGFLAPWNSGAINSSNEDYYCVTDPDLDFSTVPDDIIDVLKDAYNKYTHVTKAGVSIEINDIVKDNFLYDKIMGMETQYWLYKLENDNFYEAYIDTTFALYSKSRGVVNGNIWAGVRADRPYTVRHLPWYVNHNNITEEYRNYIKTATNASTYGKTIYKELI
jgi:hypothetical protein